LVLISTCRPLGVGPWRSPRRRPAPGRDAASRLDFRGRGVHRFALDPPSSTCRRKWQCSPGVMRMNRGRGGGKQEEVEQQQDWEGRGEAGGTVAREWTGTRSGKRSRASGSSRSWCRRRGRRCSWSSTSDSRSPSPSPPASCSHRRGPARQAPARSAAAPSAPRLTSGADARRCPRAACDRDRAREARRTRHLSGGGRPASAQPVRDPAEPARRWRTRGPALLDRADERRSRPDAGDRADARSDDLAHHHRLLERMR
jgi:hypothetical protein